MTIPAPQLPRVGALSDKLSGELASALAQRLDTLEEILTRFRISEEDLHKLLDNPTFQDMMREANVLWSSAPSTPERIKIKAQLATEDLIPELYAAAANNQNAVGARIDAAKLLYEMTGAKKAETGGGAGGITTPQDKFTLILNIGDRPVTIETQAVEAQEE